MPRIKVMAIPCDDDQPIRVEEIEQGDLRRMQELVGGYIEALDIGEPSATIFINEEGKLIGLESNRRATALLWVHDSDYRERDVIQGDVVIAGQPDDEGDTQGVPQYYLDLLDPDREFKVLVNTAPGGGFHGNSLIFADWMTAYVWGIGLALRWPLVYDIKVESL